MNSHSNKKTKGSSSFLTKMRILIAGPQGSGKSTQAKILAKKLDLKFVSAGDMVREKALEDSEEGKSFKEKMSQGRLVDEDVLARLLKEKLTQPEMSKGYILDGYPRSMRQISLFDPEYDEVIYLDMTDNEVENRLVKRGRVDDTPADIRQRLAIYHKLTEPVMDYYQKLGKLIKINGDQSIESVAEEIEQKLKGDS